MMTPVKLFALRVIAALPLLLSTNAWADDALRVTPPSAEIVQALGLAPFYTKHVDVAGFSVVASEKVPDAALLEAAWLIRHELEGRDDILRALAANKVRFVVMAQDEFTTNIPEHSTMKPAKYWDKRARGLGASRERPAVSCGVENLLCYPGDPYAPENILIHEFAHAIHQMGLSTVDKTFDARLQETYEAAMKDGLWENTYAASNKSEYWAEGAQSWFDTNRENDNQHNGINTRAELKKYDPRLAALLTEVFGDRPWRYQRPQERTAEDRVHLAGWDFEKSPRFAWPKELVDWNANTLRRAMVSTEDYVDVPLTPLPSEGAASSTKGGVASVLHFFNQRKTQVRLRWIDTAGKPHAYGLIAPTGDFMQHTFAGHTWVITDENDRPIGQCIAIDKPGKVVIQ
jgi:hypothetical protein